MKKILRSAVALLAAAGVAAGCMSAAGNQKTAGNQETMAAESGETSAREDAPGGDGGQERASREAEEAGDKDSSGGEIRETDTRMQGGQGEEGIKNEELKVDGLMNIESAVEAVYPDMASYPDEEEYFDKKTGEFDSDRFSEAYNAWWSDKQARRNLPEGCADSLTPFFKSSIRQFLTEKTDGGDENRIYSPINVYMALSMLAETTDGDSRQQILSLLRAGSLDELRLQAGRIWNASYSQDGAVTSLLANSLWLDQDIAFKEEILESLAKHYYASSYWGQMGTEELDEQLQNWLNQQTGGLLKQQASGLHMADDTLVALASTIYFRAKWSNEFLKSSTEEGVFHGPEGDITCEFMGQSGTDTYYWGEKFGAVSKSFQESGSMWLILPDEGVTPEEVLMGDEVMELFLGRRDGKNQKRLIVNLSMPKFDVVSNIDLKEGLSRLGVADVFDGSKADFTPLAEETEGVFVSQASHAARVMVDEEGCIAAAYTVMAAAGGAMPPEEQMDFILDRPFIFVITSDSGLPLFAGIVKQP